MIMNYQNILRTNNVDFILTFYIKCLILDMIRPIKTLYRHIMLRKKRINMNKANILEILNNKINILASCENIKNKEWEDLSQELKEHFDNVNIYNIIFKLKEFVDNDIAINKQEIENPNIVYRLLLYNFKDYEKYLKDAGLLEQDYLLADIVEEWMK